MRILPFLNLYYSFFIIFIILVWLNLVLFVNAQSFNTLQTPIASKVVPYNSSALPVSNAGSHLEIPKSSKVAPYNSSVLPVSNPTSYTVTNVSTTFSSAILNGNNSKQFKDSVVPSASVIIKGNKS